jgi:hypothetical protein
MTNRKSSATSYLTYGLLSAFLLFQFATFEVVQTKVDHASSAELAKGEIR